MCYNGNNINEKNYRRTIMSSEKDTVTKEETTEEVTTKEAKTAEVTPPKPH